MMTKSMISIKIDGLNMPLLWSLNLFGADFYKDVTPTAFSICCAITTSKQSRTAKPFISEIYFYLTLFALLCLIAFAGCSTFQCEHGSVILVKADDLVHPERGYLADLVVFPDTRPAISKHLGQEVVPLWTPSTNTWRERFIKVSDGGSSWWSVIYLNEEKTFTCLHFDLGY